MPRSNQRYYAICILSATLWTGCALAESPTPGFYFGLGYGGSDYSIDLDRQIRSAYSGSTDFRVNRTQLTSTSSDAYSVLAGYRFLPWLAVEVNWTDLGHASTFYELENIKPGTFTSHIDVQGRYGLRGAGAALVAEYPLGSEFTASLRAGAMDSRLDYRESGVWSSPSAGSDYQFTAPGKDRVSPLAGLGLAWHVQPQWDLRLNWDRLFGVGTDFGLSPDQDGRFNHVDHYSLNLIYRPGQH